LFQNFGSLNDAALILRWTPRAPKQATKTLPCNLQSQFLNNYLHQRRKKKNKPTPTLAAALCFTVSKQHRCFSSNVNQPAQKGAVLFPLYLLILHHVHYNPVEGIDVLPNEVLEHDECFHQKILKKKRKCLEKITLLEGKNASDRVSY